MGMVQGKVQVLSERNLKIEELVAKYKEIVVGYEIAEIYELNQFEYQILDQFESESKIHPAFGQQVMTTQTEEKLYSKDLFDSLKRELLSRLQEKESELESQLSQVTTRLSDKEKDLMRVKQLVLDKLRELENSFVDLS